MYFTWVSEERIVIFVYKERRSDWGWGGGGSLRGAHIEG